MTNKRSDLDLPPLFIASHANRVDRGGDRETGSKAKGKPFGIASSARILHLLVLLAGFCFLDSVVPFASAQGVQGDSCGNATSTAAISNCENHRYEKANSQLQSVYQTLAGHLDPVRRRKLQAAQGAWLSFRDASAEFDADVARGGTLAAVIRMTTVANMTELRAAELKKDLEEILSMK